MKLISIHVPSNKPEFFRRLCENLANKASDPGCFEVVVKIDVGDVRMEAVTEQIKKDALVNLTVVQTQRPASYFEVWRSMEDCLAASDPDYYFCWHTNDEVLVETENWDEILKSYVGYFPDHLFRLKVNPDKMFFNFVNIREICLYADYPIVPRRWLDLAGGWCRTHGPDTYQEAIAIHLARLGHHRNVPLLDVRIGGDEAGLNLSESAELKRAEGQCFYWDLSLTPRFEREYSLAAHRIALAIDAHAMRLKDFEIRQSDHFDLVDLVSEGRIISRRWFAINPLAISLRNFHQISIRRFPYSLKGKPLAFRAAARIYAGAVEGVSQFGKLAWALCSPMFGVSWSSSWLSFMEQATRRSWWNGLVRVSRTMLPKSILQKLDLWYQDVMRVPFHIAYEHKSVEIAKQETD